MFSFVLDLTELHTSAQSAKNQKNKIKQEEEEEEERSLLITLELCMNNKNNLKINYSVKRYEWFMIPYCACVEHISYKVGLLRAKHLKCCERFTKAVFKYVFLYFYYFIQEKKTRRRKTVHFHGNSFVKMFTWPRRKKIKLKNVEDFAEKKRRQRKRKKERKVGFCLRFYLTGRGKRLDETKPVAEKESRESSILVTLYVTHDGF